MAQRELPYLLYWHNLSSHTNNIFAGHKTSEKRLRFLPGRGGVGCLHEWEHQSRENVPTRQWQVDSLSGWDGGVGNSRSHLFHSEKEARPALLLSPSLDP